MKVLWSAAAGASTSCGSCTEHQLTELFCAQGIRSRSRRLPTPPPPAPPESATRSTPWRFRRRSQRDLTIVVPRPLTSASSRVQGATASRSSDEQAAAESKAARRRQTVQERPPPASRPPSSPARDRRSRASGRGVGMPVVLRQTAWPKAGCRGPSEQSEVDNALTRSRGPPLRLRRRRRDRGALPVGEESRCSRSRTRAPAAFAGARLQRSRRRSGPNTGGMGAHAFRRLDGRNAAEARALMRPRSTVGREGRPFVACSTPASC